MKRTGKAIFKILLSLTGVLLVLLIAFYLLSMGDQYVMKTVDQDPRLPYLVLEDAVLHVETFGDTSNPVVIVIHGGPGNDFQYLLPLSAMQNEYFMVFYDQRGCGLSTRVGEEELTLDNYYKDLDNLVGFFCDTAEVYLIGHSWGAMLASGYTCKYPAKVGKLVLAEPGFLTPGFGRELQEKTNNFSMKFSLQAIYYFARAWFKSLHIHGPDPQARNDFFMQELVSSPIRNHPLKDYFCEGKIQNAEMDTWRIGSLASRVIPQSGMNDRGEYIISFTEGARDYRHKVLFLAGSCNTLIGPDYQARQMKLFPDAELFVIEGAGHTMFGEKPEECIDVLRDYFEEP